MSDNFLKEIKICPHLEFLFSFEYISSLFGFTYSTWMSYLLHYRLFKYQNRHLQKTERGVINPLRAEIRGSRPQFQKYLEIKDNSVVWRKKKFCQHWADTCHNETTETVCTTVGGSFLGGWVILKSTLQPPLWGTWCSYLSNESTIPVSGFWSRFDARQQAEGSASAQFVLHNVQVHPALRHPPCCRRSVAVAGLAGVLPRCSSSLLPLQISKGYGRSTSTSPPIPAQLLECCDGWLALSLSLPGAGSWKHPQTTRQDIRVCAQALLPLALSALTLCSLSLTKDLAPDLCCELLWSQGALTCPLISGPEALFCKSKTGSYSHAKKMTD